MYFNEYNSWLLNGLNNKQIFKKEKKDFFYLPERIEGIKRLDYQDRFQ